MLWLIIFRFLLGIGIGGDYPVSATIMSEYAGKCTRGMLISFVFAMQAAGLIFGPLIAVGLLATHVSHDWVWRILLAVGALPPLAVFRARRTIHETPRYLLAAGRQNEFEAASNSIFGVHTNPEKEPETAEAHGAFWEGFQRLISNRRLAIYLIGASAAWFLMDFAYYGNTVSSPLVLQAVSPKESLLTRTLVQLAIFAVAAAPGYFVAAYTIDKIGRKLIQALGFAVMAASFAAMALIPNIAHLVVPFLIIYGISYFFTEFGPNSTTFVYPAEIFPVEGRTTGHGIASAAGKVGAFVGVFLFPFLMDWHGLFAAESAAAIICVLGLVVTWPCSPKPKAKASKKSPKPDQNCGPLNSPSNPAPNVGAFAKID